MSEWQPIETAPKDGAEILLGFAGEKWIVQGRWVGDYKARDGAWWALNNDPTDAWGGELYPTHWMPLPSPPTPAHSGDEG
jgi:hypothetical protein